jgi:hypothetical protein
MLVCNVKGLKGFIITSFLLIGLGFGASTNNVFAALVFLQSLNPS